MAKHSTRFRIIRALTLQTALCAAGCAALASWLLDVDRLHWTLTLGAFGAVGGLLMSYATVAIILRPTPRTVNIVFALMLPLCVLLALGFVAFIVGDAHLFFERKFAVMPGGAALIGASRFMKWSREEQ